MAHVLGQLSSSSNNKRQVGFVDSINWEEENSRSCRGSESRRRKREKRKMQSKQRTEKMLACLEIITDAQHVDGIVQVCIQSRIARATVLVLSTGVDDVPERRGDENVEGQLRRLLTNFRDTENNTLDSLNDQQKESIGVLMGLSAFHKKFGDIMSATVISSEENTPEQPSSVDPRPTMVLA
eukprot:scaffold34051_cov68-Attheya_sp.AAC.1